MPAPSAPLALAILLLAGGCGGSWSKSFEFGLVTPDARLSVIAHKGKVTLRESGTGRIDVLVRGKAPVPLDDAITLTNTPQRDGDIGRRLEVGVAAQDAELDIEIAVPAGISLSCSCAEADVNVSGAWASLKVSTGGTIDARVDTRTGSLKSQRGNVRFAALGAGPTGEFRAESTSGDVAVTLPASWKGQLKFQTQTGKLDVPPHAGLETIWDEGGKGVVGRLGGPREKGAPLPTVWGITGTGTASFRVGE